MRRGRFILPMRLSARHRVLARRIRGAALWDVACSGLKSAAKKGPAPLSWRGDRRSAREVKDSPASGEVEEPTRGFRAAAVVGVGGPS